MKKEHTWLVAALKAYRHTTYGQFDQATQHIVPLTQDAAEAIESLSRDIEQRTRERDALTRQLMEAKTYTNHTERE